MQLLQLRTWAQLPYIAHCRTADLVLWALLGTDRTADLGSFTETNFENYKTDADPSKYAETCLKVWCSKN